LHRKHHTLKHFHTNLAHHHTHGTPTTRTTPTPNHNQTHNHNQTQNESHTQPTPTTPLPTYPFQHHTYWLHPTTPTTTPPGHTPTNHPLLTTTLQLANTDSFIATGRLSTHHHPWLTDPAALAAALPALVVWAGDHVGCPWLVEFRTDAPPVVPDTGSLDVQVLVDGPDDDGRRTVRVSFLLVSHGAESHWKQYGVGVLAEEPSEPHSEAASSPPADEATDNEVTVDVALSEDEAQEALRHGLHPVLLDAALHTLPERIGYAAEWAGVQLHSVGATAARVRLTRLPSGGETAAEERYRLSLTDSEDRRVLTASSVTMRPLPEDGAARTDAADSLFEVAWVTGPTRTAEPARYLELRRGSGGDGVWEETADGASTGSHQDALSFAASLSGRSDSPQVVLVDLRPGVQPGEDPLPDTLRYRVGEALDLVQAWVGTTLPEDVRLTFVTRGAVGIRDGEAIDPVSSAVWGLVRSAQSEHPDRFVLVDCDADDDSWRVLPYAVPACAGSDEPQLAVRAGELWVPRLTPLSVALPVDRPASSLDPDGTVLITGGTGGLGAHIARHLVTHHNIRHLHLLSRSG
ncbi:KR domain-containing protein, partial [Streptomyces sp. NPDC056500]|uniref:SpnB-like Rossmann fold domain-containing protein n=1 Tax=Streptomyces sp. NPDC056500 TaxID=3345840 RepID=UPI0036738AF4